jgi:tRNA-splicing ligase RtcB
LERINPRLSSWASLLDENAREQAINTSKLPFIFPHVALMPDAHWGMGATVGSVIPTRHAIIPAAVGVDIGCGMMAVRTQFTYEDLLGVDLHALHAAISSRVPLSAGKYNQVIDQTNTDNRIQELVHTDGYEQAMAIAPNWHFQLGSLGSGNHFIEISLDELDRVWAFLHSGSRGVGNKLAMKYIKIAQKLNERWWIDLPDPNLAYLVEGIPEFTEYITALRWAQSFARLNREEMMDRVLRALGETMTERVLPEEVINCHHNYTEVERHFGKDVWLSRKGAIDASAGTMGLIPGSMGAASYVVRGKGNTVALNSSPHGAGRMHSRGAARKKFTREDLDQRMQGIVWGESDAFLDEHPEAYKDIDVVMNDAESMVEVVATLRQIVNVKGN